VMTDAVDVVVADGFTGNVVLKTLEGGLRTLLRALVEVFGSSDAAKGAAEVLMPALLPLYAEMDPDSTGGAMLLGVDGLCLISHGSSDAGAIFNAVRVAGEMIEADVVGEIRAAFAS
ncbi:MAG: phosphate acyltransferase, partial [Acidimicrobiia bacterium]